MEIWGRCDDCQRWFYCEGWFDKSAGQPTCPVCGSEPTAIENRADEVVLDAESAAGTT